MTTYAMMGLLLVLSRFTSDPTITDLGISFDPSFENYQTSNLKYGLEIGFTQFTLEDSKFKTKRIEEDSKPNIKILRLGLAQFDNQPAFVITPVAFRLKDSFYVASNITFGTKKPYQTISLTYDLW